MLAGRPPFTAPGAAVLFAAMKENPPALQGPAEVIAIDRVIRRAMRKDPVERYASAAEMAADLTAISLSGTEAGPVMPVRASTRIVVSAPMQMRTPIPEVWLPGGVARPYQLLPTANGSRIFPTPAARPMSG